MRDVFILIFTVLISLQGISQQSLIIPIVKDAHVYLKDAAAMNTNYGNATALNILSGSAGGYATLYRTFMEADLTNIPAEALVFKATLFLKGDAHHQISGSNAATLHKVDSIWNENTITWNNQPNFSVNVNDPAIQASTSADQDYEIDITDWVIAGLTASHDSLSFLIKLNTEMNYRKLRFFSSEYSTSTEHPYVEILYYNNPVFFKAEEKSMAGVYTLLNNKIHVSFDGDFLRKSQDISYTIKSNQHAIIADQINSNIQVLKDTFLSIDLTSYTLSSSQIYLLTFLNNDTGEERSLLFTKE